MRHATVWVDLFDHPPGEALQFATHIGELMAKPSVIMKDGMVLENTLAA